LTERDIFIEKDASERITDVYIASVPQEEFLFVDGYKHPNPEFEGTDEICRFFVSPQIAVRLVV
jgi:hypothetical protein